MFLAGGQVHLILVVIHTDVDNVSQQLLVAWDHFQLLMETLPGQTTLQLGSETLLGTTTVPPGKAPSRVVGSQGLASHHSWPQADRNRRANLHLAPKSSV